MQHSHYRYIGRGFTKIPKTVFETTAEIPNLSIRAEKTAIYMQYHNPILRISLTTTSRHHSLGLWNGQVVVLQTEGKQSLPHYPTSANDTAPQLHQLFQIPQPTAKKRCIPSTVDGEKLPYNDYGMPSLTVQVLLPYNKVAITVENYTPTDTN